MWDDGRIAKENHVWGRLITVGILIGLAAGLAGTLFPECFFYETSMFYADGGYRSCSRNFADFIMGVYHSGNYIYYLCIRVLIPFAFLMAGILSKGSALLRILVVTEQTALSLQSVLIFGAGGMEKLLLNLCFCLLPEICVLLTIIPALCEKITGFNSVKQYILTGIRGALLLCCGAVMEIYLFQCFM